MSKALGLYDSCVTVPQTRTRDTVFTEPGSRYARNFHMVVTEQKHLDKFAEEKVYVDGLKAVNDDIPNVGEWLILEDKATDLYEQIQSYRESCDLKIILKKYQNGDENALNQVNGVYADLTEMPIDLADAFAMAKNYESAFNGLPLYIRKEYGHNPARWMHAVTSGDFQKRFMTEAPKQVSKVKAEPTVSADQAKAEVKGDVTNE